MRSGDSTVDHEPPEIGPEPPARFGRFRIDRELGRGGMGVVHEAFDTVLERKVALKLLGIGAAGPESAATRVLREARAAAALQHPNIVIVHEVGDVDGVPFIAMELLRGRPLGAALVQGEVSLERRLRWLLQAARALSAAHEVGLVHRDVKPENMFVCDDDNLKILDFGIAKRDDLVPAVRATPDSARDGGRSSTGASRSPHTTAGRILGTPRYMSPEQRAGLALDPRTDQYSWGLVAFEILAGRHPAEAVPTGGAAPEHAPDASIADLLREHGVPEHVAATIARALTPDRAGRYDTMAEVVDALQEARPRRTTTFGRAPIVAVCIGIAVATGFVVVGLLARTDRVAPDAPMAVPAGLSCTADARTRFEIQGPPLASHAIAAGEGGLWVLALSAGERDLQLARTIIGEAGTLPTEAFDLAGDLPYALMPGTAVMAVSWAGKGAVVVRLPSPPVLLVATAEMKPALLHGLLVSGPGAAVAGRGDEVLVALAGLEYDKRKGVLPAPGAKSVVRVMQITNRQAPRDTLLYSTMDEQVSAPAVAMAEGSRGAVAFVGKRRLLVALVGGDGAHTGRVHEVTRGDVEAPAIAIVGKTTVVAWVARDRADGPYRLRAATLDTGAAELRPPRDLGPANVSPSVPALGILDNRAVLAWTEIAGSGARIRVAGLAEDLALEGPITLAEITSPPAASGPQMAIADGHAWISWIDGAHVHGQRVTCR